MTAPALSERRSVSRVGTVLGFLAVSTLLCGCTDHCAGCPGLPPTVNRPTPTTGPDATPAFAGSAQDPSPPAAPLPTPNAPPP